MVVITASLVLGFLGMSTLAPSANRAEPARKPSERAKAAARAQFQDTFNVDRATLLDKGSSTYMILEPSYKLILADGKDTLTITVLNETKVVDGVRTRIVEERETSKSKLAATREAGWPAPTRPGSA
jgi:hypothetical protein